MTVKELKNKLLGKQVDDTLKVFTYSDSSFIPNQYINEIARVRHKDIVYVNSLLEVYNEDDDIFGFGNNNTLYVYNVDKLEGNINSDILKNCIIKCKSIETFVDDYLIVNFPKMLDWQVVDYVHCLLPGLTDAEINWLCEICNNNVERLQNEADKINIFSKDEQEKMFTLINDDDGYNDLSPLNIFNFTNAILKKDFKKVSEILKSIDCIDIEPVGVLTLLYRNFKNILNIQLNSRATADSLGMTSKQFNAIRYNCGYYTPNNIVKIFKILTEIDYKLKSGKLPSNMIIDYLVNNILPLK